MLNNTGLRPPYNARPEAYVMLASLIFTSIANAIVIDRMAIVVGNRVIKDSDIEREIRLTDFINGDKLDLSPEARRKAAQRLIDQAMIHREVDLGRYTAPTPQEIEGLLQQVRKQHFKDEAQLRQALQNYGITHEQLESQVRWQISVLHFIEQRFRPAILVSDQESEAYYSAHQADFRDPKTGKVALIDNVRDQIQDILAAPKVTKEFEDWLDRARKRTKVEYREASLE